MTFDMVQWGVEVIDRKEAREAALRYCRLFVDALESELAKPIPDVEFLAEISAELQRAERRLQVEGANP